MPMARGERYARGVEGVGGRCQICHVGEGGGAMELWNRRSSVENCCPREKLILFTYLDLFREHIFTLWGKSADICMFYSDCDNKSNSL
jgi:hypothetical protein